MQKKEGQFFRQHSYSYCIDTDLLIDVKDPPRDFGR